MSAEFDVLSLIIDEWLNCGKSCFLKLQSSQLNLPTLNCWLYILFDSSSSSIHLMKRKHNQHTCNVSIQSRWRCWRRLILQICICISFEPPPTSALAIFTFCFFFYIAWRMRYALHTCAKRNKYDVMKVKLRLTHSSKKILCVFLLKSS